MNKSINIKILTQKDLIAAGCFDIRASIDIVENAFVSYARNDINIPDKISVVFDEKYQNRINCLPAAIKSKFVYGMKWVSVFPENTDKNIAQNLSAVILLSEIKTGFPIAFMEGTLCSNLRTAAVGAIAAKYLARKDSEVIGFIGAGEQAKSHFLSLKTVLPNIKLCKVASRSKESEEKFVLQMKKYFPDVDYIKCEGEYELAARDSDVIVTAISSQEQILKAQWIKKGVFYCHVAGLEDEYDVALMADKIVVDNWEIVKHRTQTISQMYKKGLLKDNDIYANLHEIIVGEKRGRERENEFVYFNSVGMAFADIALGNWMYNKAKEANVGRSIEFQEKSMFDFDIHI